MSTFNFFIERDLKKLHGNSFSTIEIQRGNSPKILLLFESGMNHAQAHDDI